MAFGVKRSQGYTMPIRPFLGDQAFDPETINQNVSGTRKCLRGVAAEDD